MGYPTRIGATATPDDGSPISLSAAGGMGAHSLARGIHSRRDAKPSRTWSATSAGQVSCDRFAAAMLRHGT